MRSPILARLMPRGAEPVGCILEEVCMLLDLSGKTSAPYQVGMLQVAMTAAETVYSEIDRQDYRRPGLGEIGAIAANNTPKKTIAGMTAIEKPLLEV